MAVLFLLIFYHPLYEPHHDETCLCYRQRGVDQPAHQSSQPRYL